MGDRGSKVVKMPCYKSEGRWFDPLWGIAVAQWLRCCATNRKVAGSIPVGDRGSTVVKVLCYKSEGRWFDPQLVSVEISLT